MKRSELKSFIRENIIETLSEEVPSKDELDNIEATIDRIADKSKELGIEEVDGDEDDKDAVKGAKAARGKFKKLDLAVQDLRDLEAEMRTLARDYSKAKGPEKETILAQLKVKTKEKKDREALVAKLEKDVV